MTIEEFRLTLTVKNNLLLTAIEDAGYDSVLSFCNANKLSYEQILNYVNLRECPKNHDGSWRRQATKLAIALKTNLELIFAEEHCVALKSNKRVQKVSAEAMEIELAAINKPYIEADSAIKAREFKEAMEKAVLSLSPIQRDVLTMRFGLFGTEDKTLAEIASIGGFENREDVRRIEAAALRKLRHPQIALKLEDFTKDESPYT